MKIEQKRFGNRHTFTFHEGHLNFAYSDRTGSGDMDVQYANIPLKQSLRIDENTWLRNVGILWCVIGLIGVVTKWGGGMWLPIGIGCLLWAHFSKVRYTLLNTERGTLWIIQGKQHDEILKEIAARRLNQLRAWYAEIDFENEPEQEIRKFQWLIEEGVLSQADADSKIARIREHAHLPAIEPRLLN